MSGLLTYNQSERPTSEMVGYAIRQAGVQGFLTNTQIAAATGVDDLVDDVNAAIVGPGSEANGQRESIVRALKVGKALGDLSDSRVQGATTVATLADLTWVTANDPRTGHLGSNLVP